MTDVELAIRMTADASDAADAFDSVGDSATDMAREVDNAAGKAEDATRKMGGVADAADNVDTKMGGATASLGALSGGLEAAGFEGAAGALGNLSVATDFASGAGQGLTLVLESQAVMTARAKVAAVGKAVADRAMAAASKVAAVAQWALNAAMSANPIGLVVLAVAALVAGFVLAYNKSETFRKIVDTAMGAAKEAVQAVVGVIKDVYTKVQDVIDKVPGMSGVFSVAGTLIKGYIELFLAPIKLVKEAVEWIIDHLKDLKLPGGFGDLVGAVTRSAGGASAAAQGNQIRVEDATTARNTVAITVQGAVDPYATAQQIVQLLRRYGVSVTGRVA